MKYSFMKASDLEATKAFISKQTEFVPSRKTRRKNPLDNYLKNPDLRMILAKDSGVIIGYCCYRFNVRGSGWLIGAAVSKSNRRKGIASRMLRMALDDLSKTHSRIIARTWSTNMKSRSMLEKLGFKEFRTFNNARVDGSDDLWFVKNQGIQNP